MLHPLSEGAQLYGSLTLNHCITPLTKCFEPPLLTDMFHINIVLAGETLFHTSNCFVFMSLENVMQDNILVLKMSCMWLEFVSDIMKCQGRMNSERFSLFIKSSCDIRVFKIPAWITNHNKTLFPVSFSSSVCLAVWLVAGWKLNPVVSAVYSPEFYAGRRTCPSPFVTISFVVIFLLLIHFVLQLLRHLHFLLLLYPHLHFDLRHLSLLCFPPKQHATMQSLFIAEHYAESHKRNNKQSSLMQNKRTFCNRHLQAIFSLNQPKIHLPNP